MMRVAASNERLRRDWELGNTLIESREITGIWLSFERPFKQFMDEEFASADAARSA